MECLLHLMCNCLFLIFLFLFFYLFLFLLLVLFQQLLLHPIVHCRFRVYSFLHGLFLFIRRVLFGFFPLLFFFLHQVLGLLRRHIHIHQVCLTLGIFLVRQPTLRLRIRWRRRPIPIRPVLNRLPECQRPLLFSGLRLTKFVQELFLFHFHLSQAIFSGFHLLNSHLSLLVVLIVDLPDVLPLHLLLRPLRLFLLLLHPQRRRSLPLLHRLLLLL
mmetsp:Transcript_29961/g.22222  ORF Transcript_29961/g.22222 Transcript_29961/m.22222 type:complete len:215 (-) Transcript_29961:638-1282(-)